MKNSIKSTTSNRITLQDVKQIDIDALKKLSFEYSLRKRVKDRARLNRDELNLTTPACSYLVGMINAEKIWHFTGSASFYYYIKKESLQSLKEMLNILTM